MSDSAGAPQRAEDSDVFMTEPWFSNLAAHGFTVRPVELLLQVCTPAGDVGFHLMQGADGQPLQALSNYYSCLFGPHGRVQGLEARDWLELVANMRSLPGSAVVQLQPLDASGQWLVDFEAALSVAGYWTDRYFCFGNWYQPVPQAGFSAYWTERPSALRHSVQRGRRRLDKAGPWSIDITNGESVNVEAAIEAYEYVYARSWKQPEPCSGFVPGLIRTAAREGWLRLGVLRLNGQALAAQLWLVHGDKANIYKLAYVEGFEKLSTGSILTAALMQHVMDVDHVREVDYLSGDDAYKADWMALRRERVGLLACDMRRWRGWWAAGRHLLGRWRRSVRAALPGS